MTKTFFINSTLADYGEEEFNYLQKFLLEQGILHTQGSSWADFEDLEVTEKGTPDMSVDVAIGNAVIETERASVAFKVFVFNTAVENLAIASNSSGSDRVDAVVLKLSRTVEPNALMNNVAEIEVVTGSGAVALTDGAIDTALGTDYDWIRLANVTVGHLVTTITDANIGDTRIRVSTTDSAQFSPTVLKFRVLTADPASPVEGEMWYNSTDNKLRYYDGTAVINIEASTFTAGDNIDITSSIISVTSVATYASGQAGKVVELNGDGSVDPTLQLERIATLTGEAIDGSSEPVPCFVASGEEKAEVDKRNDRDNYTQVYGTNWSSQSFIATNLKTIESVILYLRKNNSPSGDLTVSIYATSGNLPTGSALGSVTILASEVDGNYNQQHEFTFGIPVSITAGVEYAIVISVPSGDSSNSIDWYYDNGSVYADGRHGGSTTSGVTWFLNSTSYDFNFFVRGQEDLDSGKIYACDGNNVNKLELAGFIESNLGAGVATDLKSIGLIGGYTDLLAGKDYYVNDSSLQAIISQLESDNEHYWGAIADWQEMGQTITWSGAGVLKKIKLHGYKSGTPTDNIYVALYSSDKTTLLATSDAIDGSTLGTSTAEIEFTFSTPYTPTDGIEYFIRIYRDTPNNSNLYQLRYKASTNPYSGGERFRLIGTTSWNPETSTDLKFEVLSEAEDQQTNVATSPANSEVYVGQAISTIKILRKDRSDQFIKSEDIIKDTSYNIPKGCNKIIIKARVGNAGSAPEKKGDVILTKFGKTTAITSTRPSSTDFDTTFTWSGDILSVSNNYLVTATAYYYR